jgi:hypothetical protein
MPQPLRIAVPGTLATEIEHAGFREVTDACPVLDASWPGPPDEAWQEFYDVAIPMPPPIDGLPSAARRAALDEVLAELRDRNSVPGSSGWCHWSIRAGGTSAPSCRERATVSGTYVACGGAPWPS